MERLTQLRALGNTSQSQELARGKLPVTDSFRPTDGVDNSIVERLQDGAANQLEYRMQFLSLAANTMNKTPAIWRHRGSRSTSGLAFNLPPASAVKSMLDRSPPLDARPLCK